MVADTNRRSEGAALSVVSRTLCRRDRADSANGRERHPRRGPAMNGVRLVFVAALASLWLSGEAAADVFRPAYLELRQRDANTFDVTWKVPAAGDSMRL